MLANTEYQSLRSLELEIDELAGVRWAAANWQSIQVRRTPQKLAQTSGQLQALIAVFPQECAGQLASFGPT
jgi:hypothetical protein